MISFNADRIQFQSDIHTLIKQARSKDLTPEEIVKYVDYRCPFTKDDGYKRATWDKEREKAFRKHDLWVVATALTKPQPTAIADQSSLFGEGV